MHDRSTVAPRRRWRISTVLAVAAVFTAACSGGSDSDSDAASTDGAGCDTGATDATISTTALSAPRTLDPAQVDDGESGLVWNSGIFDTLLWLDNDLQVQPNAAESYEYSEDLRTLTLTLREGMTFSNGDPVTAEAVRATLERSRTTPGNAQSKLTNVASIEAPDDRTVVLNLSNPDPALLVSLTSGAGVIGHPPTIDDPNTALDPIGSGPYTLSDETVAGSTYVLERREDHWNADAFPFQTVNVRVIQDPTAALNALQAGELNVGRVQPNQVQQIQAAGFEVSEPIPTAGFGLLLLDREGTIEPALADVRVRQAINMAFDREGIVQSVLQGGAVPTNQFVNPAGDLYVEDLEGTYEYDPEGARELLAEAGYPDGFSMTMPSTVVSQRVEPLIGQALADIGIDVTWQPEPPANLNSSMQSQNYPAVFWAQGLNVTALEAQNRFLPESFLNPFGIVDPEINELMDQVATETDPEAQRELYQQIGEISVEEALFAPVANVAVRYATKDGIEYLSEGSPPPSVRRFGLTC